MKLLASVLSIAAADYACCPYNEYGVPETNCITLLTEKSPFSPNNGALVAAESHACKAWEANAGAANENHKGSAGAVVHDWGSCGFQRHFPWYNIAANTDTLGLTTSGAANYQALGVGGGIANNAGYSMLSLEKGPFSGSTAGSKPVVGEVHLGGVCKLFVPVQKDLIRQVSIAGVHVNNARVSNSALQAFSAEMNAVVVGDIAIASGQYSANFHAGTAYCFSVVNVAEFMTNRANNIANANVAGTDEIAANTGDNLNTDDQGKYYDASGVATDASFGLLWPGYDNTGTPAVGTAGDKLSGQHKVNMGSNFDVVVHFDSAWCSAHWNVVDMQKTNDHGAGVTGDGKDSGGVNDLDANLHGFKSTSGTYEGMMDAWDKRLPANTKSCGMCFDKSTHSRVPNAGLGSASTSVCATNAVGTIAAGTTSAIDGSSTFDYSAVSGTCTDINEYDPGATNRWPNAGAWAAFYSFVTCANADYMIYGKATRTVRTLILDSVTAANHLTEGGGVGAAAGDGTALNPVANNDNRMVVVGGWHQDYRHGRGACVRFNLRQVGENIEYCADGDEEEFNAKNAGTLYKNPTGDTQAWSQNNPKRCTWNWNYNALSSGTKDAEAWFDSVDPLHMQVWGAGLPDEKFIDEPAPGSPSAAANGMQALYLAATNTLTSDVLINIMIEEKRTTRNNAAVAQVFVGADTVDMDGPYATASAVTNYAATSPAPTDPAGFKTFDAVNNGHSRATITLACDTTTPAKYNGGASGAERMRDAFPDCFFGDEIHGQWTWDTSNALQDIDQASMTTIWKFWAMIQ